ncbi:hypothetical protein EVG20_g11663, partial [Dentipellis fragilis]
ADDANVSDKNGNYFDFLLLRPEEGVENPEPHVLRLRLPLRPDTLGPDQAEACFSLTYPSAEVRAHREPGEGNGQFVQILHDDLEALAAHVDHIHPTPRLLERQSGATPLHALGRPCPSNFTHTDVTATRAPAWSRTTHFGCGGGQGTCIGDGLRMQTQTQKCDDPLPQSPFDAVRAAKGVVADTDDERLEYRLSSVSKDTGNMEPGHGDTVAATITTCPRLTKPSAVPPCKARASASPSTYQNDASFSALHRYYSHWYRPDTYGGDPENFGDDELNQREAERLTHTRSDGKPAEAPGVNKRAGAATRDPAEHDSHDRSHRAQGDSKPVRDPVV